MRAEDVRGSVRGLCQGRGDRSRGDLGGGGGGGRCYDKRISFPAVAAFHLKMGLLS